MLFEKDVLRFFIITFVHSPHCTLLMFVFSKFPILNFVDGGFWFLIFRIRYIHNVILNHSRTNADAERGGGGVMQLGRG